jgi:hypothetical protein
MDTQPSSLRVLVISSNETLVNTTIQYLGNCHILQSPLLEARRRPGSVLAILKIKHEIYTSETRRSFIKRV